MSTTPPGTPSPEELQREIARLQALLAAATGAAPAASVNTQGGAAFTAPVTTHHGHVIGRDFIQVIQNLFPQPADVDRVTLALGAWLDALIAELAHPELGKLDPGLDKTRRQPLELADIYVPLNTSFSLPKGADLALAAQSKSPGELLMLGRDERGRQTELEPATALQALDAHPALTLLGLPGSGKSTFGAHVLLAHAQAWQQRATLEQLLGAPWRHGVLVPLRVVLRRFAEQHAQSPDALNVSHLWEHIAADLAANGWGSKDDALRDVQTLARRHGALFLFDGLDECGNAARRARVQQVVQQFIENHNAGRQSRFLLTARPYAFPNGTDEGRGIYLLALLGDKQVTDFINRWYAALVTRNWEASTRAQALADDLQAACQGPALIKLAKTPLLLTMTALLHSNSKRLPDDRADLYDGIVELLLQRWGGDSRASANLLQALQVPGLTLGQVRHVLELVAFDAHQASVGQESSAEITEEGLVNALRPLLNHSHDKALQLLEFIEQRAGLLVGVGGERSGSGVQERRRFAFSHRTFQEFLAACHLVACDDLAARCENLYSASFDHWRVVLPLAARLAKAERGALAANELLRGKDVGQIDKPDADHWQRAYAAGTMLQEIGAGALAAGAATTLQTLNRTRAWLQAGLPRHPQNGGAPAVRRAEMGRILAALGDPRFDSKRLCLPADDHLGFVYIEGDPLFRIGTRAADIERVKRITGQAPRSEEFNEEPTPTPRFWIGRYPVTVAQFGVYLSVVGQRWPDPRSARDPGNAPVRWVSLNDALGYAAWLQQELAGNKSVADTEAGRLVREGGYRVCLPTELEWEKAARGGLEAAVYSWGDQTDEQRANVAGSGISNTSPVGCFMANAFGLHDMLGNVWEWTESPYPEIAPSSAQGAGARSRTSRATEVVMARSAEVPRVVRGGSWSYPLRVARCAFRNLSNPKDRGSLLGFRLVLRPAPDSPR